MIGVKALALIVRPSDGALLVSEGEDGSPTGFARPLGGSLEFGERGEEAVQRELREELGCGLTNVALRTILENRFTMFGTAGHEVVFVFTGRLECTALYQHNQMPILDVPGLQAVWWTPSTHHTRLVPDGLNSHLPRAADATRRSEWWFGRRRSRLRVISRHREYRTPMIGSRRSKL